MSDPIDYSRPVGWWCPVDDYEIDPATEEPCSRCIPVYLPLPTPEPVEVDEVETGDAEVVTWTPPKMNEPSFSTPFGWTTFSDSVEEIQKICTATDEIINARKKRGMK